MTIPKTPCPVGGLVPLMGGVWPITARKAHPVLGWLYTIHEKRTDAGLVIHYNVSQEDLVHEIDLVCKFKINDPVRIGAFNVRHVVGRRWDFQNGRIIYQINDSLRTGRAHYMDQNELIARIRANEEEHA